MKAGEKRRLEKTKTPGGRKSLPPGEVGSVGHSFGADPPRGDLEGCYGNAGGNISEILPNLERDCLTDSAGGTVGEANDTDITVSTSGVAPEEFLVGAIEGAEDGGGTAPRPAITGDLIDGAGIWYCEIFEAF